MVPVYSRRTSAVKGGARRQCNLIKQQNPGCWKFKCVKGKTPIYSFLVMAAVEPGCILSIVFSLVSHANADGAGGKMHRNILFLS